MKAHLEGFATNADQGASNAQKARQNVRAARGLLPILQRYRNAYERIAVTWRVSRGCVILGLSEGRVRYGR